VTIVDTILIFLLILVVLVVVHELGHFVAAKMAKVTVIEFGLGFPPRIFGTKRGGTLYSVNAIPLGGFVKLAGEEDPNLPGALASKRLRTRALVLSAGPLMNVILPVILLAASFMLPHQILQERVIVQEVAAGSPAGHAGIQVGDTILKIDGHVIDNSSDVGYRIALHLGAGVHVLLQGVDQKQREVTVTTRWNPPPGQGTIGIVIDGQNPVTSSESLPFWLAVPQGAVTSWETLVLFKNEIEGWFIKKTAPQVAGPIGIAQITGEVAHAGVSPLFRFAALLSLNLAIFNFLPLPALDGGRLAFVALEWVRRGKKVSPQKEGMVHTIGFIAILALMALVTFLDIVRVVHGGSLLP
jgi:regulator of sigma E protease